jgi:hypothetical protein
MNIKRDVFTRPRRHKLPVARGSYRVEAAALLQGPSFVRGGPALQSGDSLTHRRPGFAPRLRP